MNDYPNRRVNDESFQDLLQKYEQLRSEVNLLRRDFEDHKELDEKTHTKMLSEMDTLRTKIDNVIQILMTHVTAEETKFDVQAFKVDEILNNQKALKTNLEKLTTDTAPAVALTNTGKYLKMTVAYLKDTIIPVIVGGALMYGFFYQQLLQK